MFDVLISGALLRLYFLDCFLKILGVALSPPQACPSGARAVAKIPHFPLGPHGWQGRPRETPKCTPTRQRGPKRRPNSSQMEAHMSTFEHMFAQAWHKLHK